MNSRIGSGSFATVFATPAGEVVKRIHDFAEVESRMLLSELAVLRYMQHPHLARATARHPVIEGGDLLFFLEHGGRDLHQFLCRGTAEEPLALGLQLVQHLLTGVAYLHQHGILHRDLKPANLLVQDGPLLQICDFGAACAVAEGHSDTRERHVVTRWYRAPEVELGLPYGCPLDLWAVGCTVAELLRSLFQRKQPLPLFGGQYGRFSPIPTQPTWSSQLATMQYALPALFHEFAVPYPEGGMAGAPAEVAPQLAGVPRSLMTALVLPLLQPAPEKRLTAAQALARLPPLPRPPAAAAPPTPPLPPPPPLLQQWLALTEEEAAVALQEELAK